MINTVLQHGEQRIPHQDFGILIHFLTDLFYINKQNKGDTKNDILHQMRNSK